MLLAADLSGLRCSLLSDGCLVADETLVLEFSTVVGIKGASHSSIGTGEKKHEFSASGSGLCCSCSTGRDDRLIDSSKGGAEGITAANGSFVLLLKSPESSCKMGT